MILGGILVLVGFALGLLGGMGFAVTVLTRRDELQGEIVREIVADILAVMEAINSKPIDVEGANDRIRTMRQRLGMFQKLMCAIK
jgi:GTPase